jgi:excisionase family DNA binding protein
MADHDSFKVFRIPGGQAFPNHKSEQLDKLLVTKAEAARLLSISEKTLYNLTKKGEIPVIRLGNRLTRYSSMDLRHWAARNSTYIPPPDPSSL